MRTEAKASLLREPPRLARDTSAPARVCIRVSGIVQGVGFRPFVYALAARHGVSGWVLNDSRGVEIEAEGPDGAVERFVRALQDESPPLAQITDIAAKAIPPEGGAGFEIRLSASSESRRTLVSPDCSVCADCLREMRDPADRRYRYPFINCTNCGPRYTIIHDLPYDRVKTTMASFEMCAEGRREYEDPGDRRFHAQPVACPACGPRVFLAGPSGGAVPSGDPIRDAAPGPARGEDRCGEGARRPSPRGGRRERRGRFGASVRPRRARNGRSRS